MEMAWTLQIRWLNTLPNGRWSGHIMDKEEMEAAGFKYNYSNMKTASQDTAWSKRVVWGLWSTCMTRFEERRIVKHCWTTMHDFTHKNKNHHSVFALCGLASQNSTQIDPPCDSKCHVCHTYVRYKKNNLFDKNTQYHGRWQWIKNAVIHSSILVSSIRILLARHIYSF